MNAAAKYAMQRPRPYVFNKSPKARAYAASQGDDAYLSFYSGHASTSFASAVAGATLFAQEDTSVAAKSTLWGLEMGLASATAMLRVRAGKHYYTDVLLGALVGSAMGMIVPALHSEGGLYSPSGSEWGSMAAGLGVGTLAGLLIPLPDEPLQDEEALSTTKATLLRSLHFAPLAHEGGGGMAVSASF